jgi:DNA end-binding protein Ku
MAIHASWKGHLKISLASIPVEAYTAAAGNDSSEVSFNQLHKTCKNRVQYKKFCPIHGEIPMSEIVSGYEYAKGQYVVVEKDELAGIAADVEKALNIECFVPPESIGPEYGAGQTDYLIPDGNVGHKPYALIREALTQTRLHGIGEMVISRKQRLVRLRTSDRLIVVDVLHYDGEVRPAVEFTSDVPNISVGADEVKLARPLVEQMQKAEFDATQYTDDYSVRLKQLIDAKLKGKKIAVSQSSEPDVANFLDALKKSVKSIPVPKAKPSGKKELLLKSTARITAPPAKKASRSKNG